MGSLLFRRLPVSIVIFAILLLCFTSGYSQPDWVDQDIPIFNQPEKVESDPGPEINDPFFAFCIALIEEDSLGQWTRDDIKTWIESTGRTSALPIDQLKYLERSALPAEEQLRSGIDTATRCIRLVMTEDLKVPLPFSIMGYHPGDLFVSQELTAIEWNLDHHILHADIDGPVRVSAKFLRALHLVEGWVVLDVDGWLDRLLGKKLDDTWFEAFVLARVEVIPDDQEDELNGMALGRSRKDRPLVGSFDFRKNKVLTNGRPVARILSGYVRPIVAPFEATVDSRAWSWPRGN
jgi:hypothetical protein